MGGRIFGEFGRVVTTEFNDLLLWWSHMYVLTVDEVVKGNFRGWETAKDGGLDPLNRLFCCLYVT